MSRYLSALFVLGLMSASWSLVHRPVPTSTSQQTHLEIQDSIRQWITQYITENAPGSRDLKFDRFWTENLTNTKIKVTFRYSYLDDSPEAGAARTRVFGYAVLNKGSETADGTEWSIDELVTEGSEVNYQDPLEP